MSDRFLFQNARIKAMESKLLTPQQLQRLVECATSQDAFKLLVELGFGQGVSVTTGDFDALFEHEEKAAVDVLRAFNADGALDAFLLACDYNNLKALYKANATGASPVLMPEGKIDVDDLKEGIAGDLSGFSPFMKEAAEKLNKLSSEDKITPRAIDTTVDKAMYLEIAEAAKRGGSSVVEYFKSKADYINVSSFLRCRKLGLSVKFFEEGFVSGGTLTEDLFVSIYESALEVLKEKCRFTPYRDIVSKVVEDGNLTAFEVEVDNIALLRWRENFNDMFSPSPIIYYYFAKNTELKAVKLVVAGIKNNVETSLIKERMRDIYGA